MFCVGLTGLIGSGKSTVGQVFKGLGVPLFDCDARAKELMTTDLREPIVEQFGQSAYLPSGELNRAYLASKVFADAVQRGKLESIVHPAVDADLVKWIERQTDARYVVIESAILIGNVIERLIDYLVVVSAQRELIIERVMRRDGVTAGQVEQRLDAQMSAELIENRANCVIVSRDDQLIVPKVVALHEKLLTLSLA